MALHLLSEDKIRLKLDVLTIVEVVLPRVCKAACKATDINVISKALYFMSHVAKQLDYAYVTQNFLPTLQFILESDPSAAVSMCVLGVYVALSGLNAVIVKFY